jgi:hypothetical protein
LALGQIATHSVLGGGEGIRAADLSVASRYDPEIPLPSDSLGFEVGAWHVRPEQMIPYFERLAAASPRVALEIQGFTHERRPQPLLLVTSPANHARLEELRRRHLELVAGLRSPEATDPVVILLGFSIHGNEPSGANAALLVAYHLAAEQGGEVEQWLDSAIILLDPSFNPDGLARFANWVNSNRGVQAQTDPQTREHQEPWPRGRTNHYFFDLNRDWLLAQQPESRNRLATFHRWRPNLLTDHHEMGPDSTFFFQPGVPERTNPLIPQSNLELTHQLAEYHADALDAAGRLYYSEEGFDDFYPGKGSTYPDLQGSVGILFEQAGSDGHARDTANGVMTFPFTIGNHYYAALSSVRGAVAMREGFLRHQVDFTVAAQRAAAQAPERGYLVQVDGDLGRLRHLLDYFEQHHIQSAPLAEEVVQAGVTFPAGTSLFVGLDQAQSTLIRSLFEPLQEFEDQIFYDVSTWSLPLAFGARVEAVARSAPQPKLAESVRSGDLAAAHPPAPEGKPTLAYAFRWSEYYAPRALATFLQGGARARVAVEPLQLLTDRGPQSFPRGTVLVPASLAGTADLEALATTVANRDGVEVFRVLRGLAASGVDLGSPSVRPVELPQVALLGGDGTSSNAVGESWHLLDYRFRLPTTVLDGGNLGRSDLDRYTHIVLANGFYSLGQSAAESLRAWVRAGGTLVGLQGGAHWIGREFSEADEQEPAAPDSEPLLDDSEPRVYADYRRDRAAQLIGGTIVGARFDLTHPLAYGYANEEIALFRSDAEVLVNRSNPYETVGRYVDPPRLSGYISQENQGRLAGTPAVVAYRFGRGNVVLFADNPNFRSVWFGTSKLFLNALFLSDLIAPTSAPSTWNRE